MASHLHASSPAKACPVIRKQRMDASMELAPFGRDRRCPTHARDTGSLGILILSGQPSSAMWKDSCVAYLDCHGSHAAMISGTATRTDTGQHVHACTLPQAGRTHRTHRRQASPDLDELLACLRSCSAHDQEGAGLRGDPSGSVIDTACGRNHDEEMSCALSTRILPRLPYRREGAAFSEMYACLLPGKKWRVVPSRSEVAGSEVETAGWSVVNATCQEFSHHQLGGGKGLSLDSASRRGVRGLRVSWKQSS
ncbi:uncharacterized protein PV09_07218 [Verruconis gallopava]|uniref:Uncharacterized protein n=1 Tax=Verruconis gallopava TaxID=253628 RepID=A0A0D1XGX9_9PEZI|nr:uncharacterized protein PV09_07218 [Verruconis gallopava]KIW01461.1 hypothetical protein PV09_07218 [Verruconis gallopava]